MSVRFCACDDARVAGASDSWCGGCGGGCDDHDDHVMIVMMNNNNVNDDDDDAQVFLGAYGAFCNVGAVPT